MSTAASSPSTVPTPQAVRLGDIFARFAESRDRCDRALDNWAADPGKQLDITWRILHQALEFQWASIDYNADPSAPQAQVVRMMAWAMHRLSLYSLVLDHHRRGERFFAHSNQ